MISIGLVLGAGGVIGQAYHVGTLSALADVTGWDARGADLIVGTSAGSGVAATLRLGFSPADHYARSQREPLSDEGARLMGALPPDQLELPDRPDLDPAAFLRPMAPWLAASAFLAPGPIRPGLLSGLLPRGRVSTAVLGDRIRALSAAADQSWPSQPTWICTTRVRDGKRVVFGRDDVTEPDLGTAVEASSAVPGLFSPVRIGRHNYFDGATFSPTNADLVARLGFDLVIVVSPMSAVSTALGRSLDAARRMINARTVAREVAKIRETGTPVLTIQPTADDLDAMPGNLMDRAAAGLVARRAAETLRGHLEQLEADGDTRPATLRQAAQQPVPTR